LSAALAAAAVSLRALDAADAARLLAWRNSPEVARHMYSDHVIAPEEHTAWLAGALADPRRRYWIIELDGAPVGLANLYDIEPIHRRCSWAYYLADPATRGRGVGTYVEYFVLTYVFDRLNLNKLCCEVFLANEAVWKMHESFGFEREGLYRDHIMKAGKFEDVVALAMRAAAWREKKPALRERLTEKGFTPPRSDD
jgi:UDP-4-amino-4,6-dideoxy-N-acetyl-beta-L-altrosamine N-acetyltransferase